MDMSFAVRTYNRAEGDIDMAKHITIEYCRA